MIIVQSPTLNSCMQHSLSIQNWTLVPSHNQSKIMTTNNLICSVKPF